jgi:predicted nucleic acid-binding protein
MIRVAIDASVLLKAYFRDERGHEAAQELIKLYARGDYDFMAPSLIAYEIMNACSIAHRKGRIGLDLVREILNEMFSLEILKKDVAPLRERIFEISCHFSRSAYDASYVALAEVEQCDFVTGDEKLCRAISKDFPFLKLVQLPRSIFPLSPFTLFPLLLGPPDIPSTGIPS